MTFYHITTPEHWSKYAADSFYEAESLHSEGFIHGSFAEQLDETLAVYYKSVEKVLILTIEEVNLESELKVEKSRNGQFFPHVYGRLNKSAISNVEERELKN
jgi:uncharacterized protein (DUF952 family)